MFPATPMKSLAHLSLTALCAAAAFTLTGCGKSTDGTVEADETTITGKPSDPPVALRAAWRPGWTYEVFVQSQQTADLGMGGRGRGGAGGPGGRGDMETTFKQDLAINATNLPNGGVNLDMELLALGVTMFTGSDTALHYDSAQQTASGQAEQVAAMLDTLIGGHFDVVLDAKGKMVKVEGIEELVEKATATAGGGEGGDRGGRGGRGGMAGGMMGGRAGAGMMQRFMGDTFFRPLVEFPGQLEGPARVGQSWTNQQDLSIMSLLNVTVVTTNTFRGWQVRDGHKCARIEITGTIEAARRPPAQGGGGFDIMRMLGDMSIEDAEVTGTIWLDPKLEFPREVSTADSPGRILGKRARKKMRLEWCFSRRRPILPR
jgi:hypothetical protein